MVRLLVWGTGHLAEKFLKEGYSGEIIGFVETRKAHKSFMGKPVYSCMEIPNNYDFIIVANSFASEIYDLCIESGIDLSKMIFLYGLKRRVGYTDLSVLKKILLEKNYTRYCAEFGIIKDTFFENDIKMYNQLNTRSAFSFQEQYMWPVLQDKYDYAGAIGNYFLQDLWAARLIINSGVKNHFDIGSRLDGFIAHLLAAEIDVTMIDVREFPGNVDGLHTIDDDATNLNQIADRHCAR